MIPRVAQLHLGIALFFLFKVYLRERAFPIQKMIYAALRSVCTAFTKAEVASIERTFPINRS